MQIKSTSVIKFPCLFWRSSYGWAFEKSLFDSSESIKVFMVRNGSTLIDQRIEFQEASFLTIHFCTRHFHPKKPAISAPKLLFLFCFDIYY